MKSKKDSELIAAAYSRILENTNTDSNDIAKLAAISDEALFRKYGWPKSVPGSNTFGWQSNLKSAEYAFNSIKGGETDIERISDEIHKGWNETAKRFVQDPDQFDDTQKLRDDGKLDAKLAQRKMLMNLNYSDLEEKEKEKDRVVARALIQVIGSGSHRVYDDQFPVIQ